MNEKGKKGRSGGGKKKMGRRREGRGREYMGKAGKGQEEQGAMGGGKKLLQVPMGNVGARGGKLPASGRWAQKLSVYPHWVCVTPWMPDSSLSTCNSPSSHSPFLPPPWGAVGRTSKDKEERAPLLSALA